MESAKGWLAVETENHDRCERCGAARGLSAGEVLDAARGHRAFRTGWTTVPEGAGYAAGSRRARAWGILAMRRHQPRQPPPSVPPHPRGFVAEEMIPKS